MRYFHWNVDDTETWTELANSFVPMDHRYHDPNRLHVQLTAQETIGYRLLHWDQHGARLAHRTRSHVRRVPGDEFYWVVIPEHGVYSMRYDDRVTRVPPGQATITGLDEVCDMHIPHSAAYAFQVPRAEVEHRVRPTGPLRVLLDMNSGLGRVTRDMLRSVHAEQANLSAREFSAICDRISELLCMLSVGDRLPQQAQHAAVAESIRRYVRDNIGSGDIRLPAVASALGWSPRQLRIILRQADTTFRDVRQEESLRAARDLLADPAHRALTIGELATRSGFTPTWFSAAFKARYGETPRDFRQRRLAEHTDQSRVPGGGTRPPVG